MTPYYFCKNIIISFYIDSVFSSYRQLFILISIHFIKDVRLLVKRCTEIKQKMYENCIKGVHLFIYLSCRKYFIYLNKLFLCLYNLK